MGGGPARGVRTSVVVRRNGRAYFSASKRTDAAGKTTYLVPRAAGCFTTKVTSATAPGYRWNGSTPAEPLLHVAAIPQYGDDNAVRRRPIRSACGCSQSSGFWPSPMSASAAASPRAVPPIAYGVADDASKYADDGGARFYAGAAGSGADAEPLDARLEPGQAERDRGTALPRARRARSPSGPACA